MYLLCLPTVVYTSKEYNEVKGLLNENAKAKKEYEAKVKEYNAN
jgi:hypothetical protein